MIRNHAEEVVESKAEAIGKKLTKITTRKVRGLSTNRTGEDIAPCLEKCEPRLAQKGIEYVSKSKSSYSATGEWYSESSALLGPSLDSFGEESSHDQLMSIDPTMPTAAEIEAQQSLPEPYRYF